MDERVRRQVERETAFWSADPCERPGVDTIENLLNKSQDAAILFELLSAHEAMLRGSRRIVEIGGGQGWAACMVKRLVPNAHVVVTDAVAEAVQSHGIWERVFDCKLDGAYAAPAQVLPFESGSVDLLFCYAAAHHFVDYAAALRETRRVLSVKGRCIWFYEPTTPGWLQAVAERRVNRKRPDVPEHVIVPAAIAKLALEASLQCMIQYCTSIAHRGRVATLYYTLLGAVPMLQWLLPCTAHFTFRRIESSE